jgi:photosystem II stability/assembly factor-like uncharacterized protein
MFSSVTFSQWNLQRSDLKVEFRGLSVADEKVAWVSGSRNTYARTTDGGTTWEVSTVADPESLDFRDVEAVDANTAYLLSIGTGTKSRIYKTTDGGKSWSAQVANLHPQAFLDAFAFWDARNGVAVGDPIDGRFLILRTTDGGARWERVPADRSPQALPGDGVFAASGTTIAVHGNKDVWFGTGGSKVSRVFASHDGGRTWSASNTPVISSQASTGIFSVAFRDALHGIVVGGDYRKVDEARDNIARTADGGRTWTLIQDSGLGGFRSCVSYLPGSGGKVLVAVGPAGSDFSTDGGMHWEKYDTQGFHVFAFARSRPVGWAAGAGGRIAGFQPILKSIITR